MNLKRILLLNFVVIAIVVALTFVAASAQTVSPCPSAAPDQIHIHYSDAGIIGTTPPITMDQAVQIATSQTGIIPTAQTPVNVQYVLFTDDDYYTETNDQGGVENHLFVNTPVWVVTVCGLNLASGGGPGSVVTYNHELNIIIDARTGKMMETYTYE